MAVKKQQNIFLRLLKLVLPFKWQILLAVMLGFLTVGSSVGLMGTAAFIIAAAALHPALGSLMVPITGVRFFGISRGVFRYAERITSHNTTFKLLARLRVWFYEKLEPLAPARLARYRRGDLMSRIVSDIETLDHFYVNVLAPPLVAILIAAAMYALLGYFDNRIALMFLLFYTITGVLSPLIANVSGRQLGKKLVEIRSNLHSAIIDGIQGLADLTVYQQLNHHKENIRNLNKELTDVQLRLSWINALHNGLGVLLANLGMVATLVVAIPLAEKSQFDGVFLAVIAMATLSSFEATLALPQAFLFLEKIKQSARRLFEIIDAEPEITPPASPSPQPQHYAIEISNLTFGYEPDKPVLNNLSVSIPQGQRIAIVGPSGAGKSTIVNLLMRFWDYQQGSIRLGGHEIKDFHPEDIKRYFAVVSQDTYLFNTTIEANLRLARPDATEEQILEALRQAQLYDFVMSLPQGLQTYVGEYGMAISGGERQRLAIARALLKDAPILILDEATANLDAITERQILSAIETLMHGRTTLMITHRLVGMDKMHRIYVIKNGQVIEQGSHSELLRQGGLYARMFRLQSEVVG